jgi:hypothetical protein
MIPTDFASFVPRMRLAVSWMLHILAVCLVLFMAATRATAMEWTAKLNMSVDGGAYIYSGVGPVEQGDAGKLEKLYASNKRLETAKSTSARSVVRLDSTGGSILAGLELGDVIRKLGLDTEVPASAGCYSSCTFAFLGGIERRVEGKFGIHALSLSQGTPSSTTLDEFQNWAAILVQYTRDMIGKSDMAEMALKISASGIGLVQDDALRDWNIITIAARPSQLYPANEIRTFKCGSADYPNVSQAVCNGLVLARLDRRISAALVVLKGRPFFDRIETEQQRWSSYRNQCEDAFPLLAQGKPVTGRRTGTLGVIDCLSAAYGIRVKELEALVAYFEAGETATAKKGWKVPAR